VRCGRLNQSRAAARLFVIEHDVTKRIKRDYNETWLTSSTEGGARPESLEKRHDETIRPRDRWNRHSVRLWPPCKCAPRAGRVAIIDFRPFGGTCALRGCDPKKVLVAGAETVDGVGRMRGRGVGG